MAAAPVSGGSADLPANSTGPAPAGAALAQSTAPPLFPTSFCIAGLKLPTKETQNSKDGSGGGGGGGGLGLSGLGMSMGSLKGSRKEASTSEPPPPVMPAAGAPPGSPALQAMPLVGTPTEIKTAQFAANGGILGSDAIADSAAVGGVTSPQKKKGQFSLPGLPSFAGGNGGAPAAAVLSSPNMGANAANAPVPLEGPSSRPKTPFRGTSSSFVRSWEGIPPNSSALKAYADANGTHAGELNLAFYTQGKALFIAEMALKGGPVKESLARLTFATFPTSVDVNQATSSADRLDVLVGFSTGDILWFDPFSAKYTRLNKAGAISSSPISSIKWLRPRSPPAATMGDLPFSLLTASPTSSLFITSHYDGSVMVWDKDKEDLSSFVPITPAPSQAPASPTPTGPTSPSIGSASRWLSMGMKTPRETASDDFSKNNGYFPAPGEAMPTASAATTPGLTASAPLPVMDDRHAPVSSTHLEQAGAANDMIVTRPPAPAEKEKKGDRKDSAKTPLVGTADLAPATNGVLSPGATTAPLSTAAAAAAKRYNPVTHWKVSKKKVTAFDLSPDHRHCAITSEDGCLRIIEVASEKLVDTFAGYFGAINCVAWCPNGKYVATGGQDDLCTIFAHADGRIVARCQGHSSFVTSLAWDRWFVPQPSSSAPPASVRLGSVGEDGKVIFWEFDPDHLAAHPLVNAIATSEPNGADIGGRNYHPAPKRSEVALLELHYDEDDKPPPELEVPRKAKPPNPLGGGIKSNVSRDILIAIRFTPTHCFTGSRAAQVRSWERPVASAK